MPRPRLATRAAPPASTVVPVGPRPSPAQRSRCRRREAVCHGPRPAGGIGGRCGRGSSGVRGASAWSLPVPHQPRRRRNRADFLRPENGACRWALTRRGSDGAEGGGGLPPCLPPVSSSARLCHGPLCASSEARRGSQRPPEVPCLPATHGGPQKRSSRLRFAGFGPKRSILRALELSAVPGAAVAQVFGP